MNLRLDIELRAAERLYSEEWIDEHLPFWGEVDKLCETTHATSTIRVFLGLWDERCRAAIFEIRELIQEVKLLESKGEATLKCLNEIRKGMTFFAFPSYLRQDRMELKKINYQKAPPEIVAALEVVTEQANYVFALRENFDIVIKRLIEEIQRAEETSLPSKKRASSSSIPKQLMIEARHAAVTDGIVYIMTNALMPGISKIGFTTRNPDMRALEITQKSGLPEPFKVERYWRTRDPYIVEQRIFAELEDCRVDSFCEYFRGSVADHEEVVKKHLLT